MSDADADLLDVVMGLRDYATAFLATRYFMVVNVTLVLYDHFLTFHDEVEYIWGGNNWLHKLIFIVNRYIVEATLVGTAYVTLELRPELSDNGYLIPVALAAILCMAVSHLTITLRVDALWEFNKTITHMVVGAFAITYSIAVAFFIMALIDLRNATFFFPPINTCITTHSPPMANGTWAAMVSFDVLVLILVLVNAVNRPYREISEVVSNLNKDGIVLFLAILTIRVFNLVFSLTPGRSETFLVVYFMWAIIAISVCRLILRAEARDAQAARAGVQLWMPETERFELKAVNRRSMEDA